jgi:luciferase family oxidoreductase group 1
VVGALTGRVDDLRVPLSVLDLVPVGEGSSPGAALRASLDLVRRAEELGYHRHWVAEHHNMPGIASSSPPVLLAHLASVTSTIRLGSGGVMLPNHAPLVVAEQFGMLEALHPGRSARALTDEDFPRQLGELLGFFNGFADDHPYRRITAVPGLGHQPALWLLGSSDYSAQVAGLLGLPFSFAHHFASGNTDAAVAAYRSTFRPIDQLERPYLMLGVAVICAETVERARWLAGPARLAFLRLRSGRPGRYPTPEEAAGYTFTPHEREVVKAWMSSHVVGDPDTVRRELADLVARTGADELIVTTLTHDPADRLRSYELLAEATGLPRGPGSDHQPEPHPVNGPGDRAPRGHVPTHPPSR